MQKLFFFWLINCFFIANITAQSLYMSNEFVKAYQNNTRNSDGTPGENYFINFADYNINVFFDPATGKLSGNEAIIYHNQSNDTLNQLVLRVYKDIFKRGNPRDYAINPDDANNGVNIKTLKINGTELTISKLNSYGTNYFINLPNGLLPGSTVKLTIEWEFTMPQKTAIRNGKYAENIYFVGYWYPRIAVYDDVFGWDNNIFTGAQEFYNDHSNYDVKITVPYPNIVWATGTLKNSYDVFTKKYADRIKNALNSNEVVHILTPEDYNQARILKNKKQNTWHFVADKVPDFAFATSDRHNWDAVGTSMPDRTQRVLISGVYADSSEIYHTLADVSRKIINYYSFKRPQIYYPYPAMTVFEGGGGMEYPMMVNEGDVENKCSFYYITAHEIGHSYFPFYTGTNETKYAWMDEGLISFFPRFAIDDLFDCNSKNDIAKYYQLIAGSNTDLPIMTPSDIFKDFRTYRNIAYYRPAYAFYILHDYLGDSLFFAALRTFVKNWHYKHPYPYDFFYTFDNVANEDLSWIWKPFFFEFSKPDLALTNVQYRLDGLYFSIENKGGMPLPIYAEIIIDKNKKEIIRKQVNIWKSDKYKIDFYIPTNTKPVKIQLGDETIPDTDLSNNIFIF